MDKYKSQIESTLGAFWDARAIALVDNPTSVSDLGAPLTSLDACDALVELENLIGQKLPLYGIVKNGGYEDRKSFVNELTANLMNHLGNEQDE